MLYIFLPILYSICMENHLAIDFRTTRFEAHPYDPPTSPPPYSSMIDDVYNQFAIIRYQESQRYDSILSVRNQAGQHHPVNGELGRFSLPTKERLSVLGAELGAHPSHWCIPEANEGVLFSISI